MATMTTRRELYEGLIAEQNKLVRDALLGRFVRLHMVELVGGWQINQTFIPGAPSLEDVTDAINPKTVAAMPAR